MTFYQPIKIKNCGWELSENVKFGQVQFSVKKKSIIHKNIILKEEMKIFYNIDA